MLMGNMRIKLFVFVDLTSQISTKIHSRFFLRPHVLCIILCLPLSHLVEKTGKVLTKKDVIFPKMEVEIWQFQREFKLLPVVPIHSV